jgi:hypothetical protein
MILWLARLKISTKLGLGTFLCLSVFMMCCSITRASGTFYRGAMDYAWQEFWVHAEGCVAVIMGSITAFRLAIIGSKLSHEEELKTSSLLTYFSNIRNRLRWSRITRESDVSKSESKPGGHVKILRMPTMPSATISGFRTVFGGRTQNDKHAILDNSEIDLIETEYHTHLRNPAPTRGTQPSLDQLFHRRDDSDASTGKSRRSHWSPCLSRS